MQSGSEVGERLKLLSHSSLGSVSPSKVRWLSRQENRAAPPWAIERLTGKKEMKKKDFNIVYLEISDRDKPESKKCAVCTFELIDLKIQGRLTYFTGFDDTSISLRLIFLAWESQNIVSRHEHLFLSNLRLGIYRSQRCLRRACIDRNVIRFVVRWVEGDSACWCCRHDRERQK